MNAKLLAQLATLGPIGQLRPAPGTWGSLAGVVSGLFLLTAGPVILEAAIIIICLIGVAAANAYEDLTGKKDASEVIIDEVAGQWIVLLAIPIATSDPNWSWWAAAAFALFRLLDITKIGPIGMAEKLPRGIGVMADDIIAGVIGAAILWAAALLMGV